MIHVCAVSAKRKQYLEDSEDEAEFVEIEEEDEETYCKLFFSGGGGGGGQYLVLYLMLQWHQGQHSALFHSERGRETALSVVLDVSVACKRQKEKQC